MNERTKKSYSELVSNIDKLLEQINVCKEEINNFDEQIVSKNNEVENTNNAGNELVEQLNDKIRNLQNNVSVLENQKYKDHMEYETKKYTFEEQIKQLLQEIEDLEDQLNTKLNGMTSGVVNLYLKYDNNTKNYNPEKDNFSPSVFGYSLREFEFIPKNGVLLIKDMRNKITEKKIKYDWIKRISIDSDSVKLVEEIESKYYSNERDKNKDPNRKKKIKFFITLRRSNLDLVAKEYNDYKRFADIINSIVIHK
jgi:DNA repair exonuclease SbcCD ATPase subunit